MEAKQTEEKYTGRSAVRLAHHAWSVSVAGIARQTEEKYTGRSAVRLAHLVWDQGVAGSNPAAPTKGLKSNLQTFFNLKAKWKIKPIKCTYYIPRHWGNITLDIHL